MAHSDVTGEPQAEPPVGQDAKDGPASTERRRARQIDVKILEEPHGKMELGLIISLTSLLLSLLAAGAAFYAWILGPEVDVGEPELVYFYREGAADQGILKFGIRVTVANTADAQYGDALMSASAILSDPSRQWEEEATAQFSLSEANGDGVPAACESPVQHCVRQGRFLAIEEDFSPRAFGGGAIATHNIVFAVAFYACRGEARACEKTGLFGAEVQKQLQQNMDITVNLDFLREGRKSISCRIRNIDLDYLKGQGFLSRQCLPKDGVSS